MAHPQHVQDMIDDFSFLEDWEDRYMHVIDMGKALTPLTIDEKTEANRVKGCTSQVWLLSEQSKTTPLILNFRGDSDAHIVRGLVAIILRIYSGQTPRDILKINMKDVLHALGLDEHLSTQRLSLIHI